MSLGRSILLRLILLSAIMLAFFLMAEKSHGAVVELTTPAQVKMELAKPGPVVLLYYATWCGPCRTFHPTYEKASEQIKDVRFYTMDGDKIGLREHQGNIHFIPAAFYGADEKSLRDKPCKVIEGAVSLSKFKAGLAKCRKVK